MKWGGGRFVERITGILFGGLRQRVWAMGKVN